MHNVHVWMNDVTNVNGGYVHVDHVHIWMNEWMNEWRNTMDTKGRIRQGPNKQMSSCTKIVKQKQKKQEGTRDRNTNSEQLEFECQLKTPTRGCIHELLNLGASSSQNKFQSLLTNQDLLRLREDMWPSHKTQRKGWWCRAFATAINRQCPTCNRLWTSEQFPPSLAQCLTCLKMGAKKKPSRFKLQDNEVGLIFRSALPEESE